MGTPQHPDRDPAVTVLAKWSSMCPKGVLWPKFALVEQSPAAQVVIPKTVPRSSEPMDLSSHLGSASTFSQSLNLQVSLS